MNTAYLMIGGNIGDRRQYLEEARNLLEFKVGPIQNLSKVYETAPWGGNDQNAYLNQAVKIFTPLDAENTLKMILNIEYRLKRERSDHQYQSRTIDIDILFFNNEIIHTDHLHIPHPRLQLRNFVLIPLCDIAADFMHPLLHKYIWQLRDLCEDKGDVHLSERD
jgi:2-amino-4-hydroxy-6-hydroxymethyldihydropteridine diphosphokinase